MNFLWENWHLILLGGVVLVVLIWEILVKRKPSQEHLLRALLLIVATYGVAWVTQEYKRNRELSGDIEYFLSQISDRADNEYAKGLLEELHETLRKYKGRTIEAVSEAEVRDQQIKALKKTKRSAVFVDHYVLVWGSSYELELRENVAAIGRGVEVRRIWIISEALLGDDKQVKDAIQVMEKQKNLGIRVSYVLQRDLQSLRDYQRFADVDYALFDDEVLIKVGARASPVALPSYCFITWDKTTVLAETPFTFIAGTGLIKDFDDTSKELLTKLVRRGAPPSSLGRRS